jgi:hypothetical protein
MRTLAWLTITLAVPCVIASCTDGDDDYPVLPGDSPPVAGTGDITEGGEFRGQVCRAIDLVEFTSCDTAAAGGLTVSLGGVSTITAPDGSFVLPRPAGSLLAFRVSGPGAITTTTPFSPSLFVPVVDADVWARFLASNSISLAPGAGSILGSIVRAGVPASGVFVQPSPASAFGPFFDTVTGFGLDATGARGVFLAPGVTAGGTNLTLRDVASGRETLVNGISVINGGVTILDSIPIP